ncbi:recombinase family protein [Pedobacter aquatilis]|uniref:recombinase family protein n=1 Tax=Pedobacter aquatilis TaxID=351343 RepID=UPI00292F3F1B|nr:recombinase family protein [Pedobacter aquatilis]
MNAVCYLRLSTKDQSKSLEYQESIVRDYCKRNKLKILEVFRDNGENSYTFKRNSYLALEDFIKKHKSKCQYLVVLDHDRFSRNLPEALMKIAELERKYDVKVISTNEPINLDTSDSDVFMKRAFEYLIAHRELLTIKNRTRLGILNAKEKGRFLGKAPFGYLNIKKPFNDQTIEINSLQSYIIKKIFSDFEAGVPQKTIHKEVLALGFKNRGSNAINDILRNSVYAGLIKINAFKNISEKYVKALHEPIIPEADFWRIQKILDGMSKRRTRANEEFPLRGVIKCPCGRNLTAGWTKGNRKYYLYYKCVDHPSINIPGETMHKKFEELLKKITLQKHQVDLLNSSLLSLSDELLKDENKRQKEKLRLLRNLREKNLRLEQKFIADQISVSVYHKWREEFKIEKKHIECLSNNSQIDKANIENVLSVFKSGRFNFYKLYRRSDILQKQLLVRAIFKDYLTWDQGIFTSNYFNEHLQFNLRKASINILLVLSLANKIITDQNSKAEHLEMRRALRRPRPEETKIKCHKDEKFIKSITQIIAEIVKSGDKTGKNVLS